jgi:hypothetical protein
VMVSSVETAQEVLRKRQSTGGHGVPPLQLNGPESVPPPSFFFSFSFLLPGPPPPPPPPPPIEHEAIRLLPCRTRRDA